MRIFSFAGRHGLHRCETAGSCVTVAKRIGRRRDNAIRSQKNERAAFVGRADSAMDC
jgi:hypothetical protein